jgi:hypothetical protein
MSRKIAAGIRGRRGEAGDVLVSSLLIKVFNLGNNGHTLRILRPSAGRGWTSDGVDLILDKVAEDLDRRFPNEQFRLVELIGYQFNFVHAGPRATAGEESDGAPDMGVQSGESRPE